MNYIRIICIIPILFLSSQLMAKDYIFINSLKSRVLPEFQKNELSRISLQIIIRTDKYEILFNEVPKDLVSETENKNAPKVISLNFKVTRQERTRNDSYFKLEFFLRDLRVRKKIKRVIRQKVLGRRFLFESRLALYELFYGKEYLKKNKDKIVKEAKEEKTAQTPAITPLPPQNEIESLPPQPHPNEQSKKFQKKISKLKSEIDDELNKKRKKKKKKRSKSSKQSKQESSTNSNLSKNDLVDDKSFFKIEKKLEYSFGYEYQSIITTKEISGIDISTKSNYELMPFYARVYSHLPGNEYNLILTGLGFKKVIASDSFDIKTPYNIDFGFKKIFNGGYVLQTKLDYSSQDYILLNRASEGLSTTNIKNLVIDLKFEKRFSYLSRIMSIGVNYATSLITETDQYTQKNLKSSLRSSQYSIITEFEIINHLYCLLQYEYITYQSDSVSDFNLESNNVLIALTYR